MKNANIIRFGLTFLFSIIMTGSSGIFAQVASTNCAQEMKDAFQNVNFKRLVNDGNIHLIRYTRTSQHKEQQQGKKWAERKSATIAAGVAYMIGAEEEVYTDEKEAFSFYPYRSMIYRTKSMMDKTAIVKEFDNSIWMNGQVITCDFVKATDTTANKRTIYRINPGTKSDIKEIEMVFSPFDGNLKSIEVRFREGADWIMVSYDFEEINHNYQPKEAVSTAAAHVLDEAGKAKGRFLGASVMDYRR